MIASVAFRNYKALRNTRLGLAPFNLVIGPNGSGKSSLIQAVMRLKELSALPISEVGDRVLGADQLEVSFRFSPPHADIEARLSCSSEFVCDLLQIRRNGQSDWEALQTDLEKIRTHVFDHAAIATGVLNSGRTLSLDGGNLAHVLIERQRHSPQAYQETVGEFCRMLPEFKGLAFEAASSGAARIAAILADDTRVPAENLSQGTLYVLAMLTLAFDPEPASLLCIEEIDRGLHPRMLREVRDAFYRLSYPSSFGSKRRPVQVIATTHSPYLLDLFREHPEEVVIAQKHGTEARFERLADRADIHEILQEGALGDMWFSGILGGVPDEEPAPRAKSSTRT